MKANIIFICLITQLNSFTLFAICGTTLQDCKIKFHDRDWQIIKDCDQTDFDPSWIGDDASALNLNINYNLGDKIYVWIKVFNNLPDYLNYYCNIFFHLYINEYYINNNKDYIYYCTNCGCSTSHNDKTFCHLGDDKRLDCTPVRGKEYQFYFMINGYNELNLMEVSTIINDYYKIIGYNYYLSEEEETKEIKFSSNSILKSSYYPDHKVILDELLIKYSFEGYGEFRTKKDEILHSSGEIDSDIIFIKPKNITGNEMFNTKLKVKTISKFGQNKGTTTSEIAEFNFYFCSPEYKLYNNSFCYKCFESCFSCSKPGNFSNHHCDKCNHQNPYYFYTNSTKNCFNSCKSANKIRKEKDKHFCIDKEECKNYISSNEESCILNCSSELEYLDNRTGNVAKICLSNCDGYISYDNTICLDSCKRINQLINNITANKRCTTENICILYNKFIDSKNNYCLQNCSSVLELQDYRNKDYRPYCLPYKKCDTFISNDKTKCIKDCPSEQEYFDDREGTRSNICLKKEMCDSWISSNDTICLNDCKIINELSDITSHLCVNFCSNDLFYTPQLMTCDKQCNVPYKFYITYENKTKKCVEKCDEYPYLVLDEDNFECLVFKKFDIKSIQTNPILNSDNKNFPIYYVEKNNKNLTIKITFNQQIRNRIKLFNGTYERISEDNNSIIVKISELNNKKTFNFSDNINESYYFGFELQIISRFDHLILMLIIICGILLVLLIIISILYCKNRKNRKESQIGKSFSSNNYLLN